MRTAKNAPYPSTKLMELEDIVQAKRTEDFPKVSHIDEITIK